MPRIPTDYLVAGAIALAVAAWMATGLLRDDAPSVATGRQATTPGGEPAFTVETATVTAEPIARRVVAQGHVVPTRAATLRAQTAGQVEAVAAAPGQRVAQGTVLVRLALDDRESRLREAQALRTQREAELEAALRLGESGFQARLRQDEARTALASAVAAVERMRLEIGHTRVAAPFDGVIDERLVDVGDFAARGDPLVTLVDNDPLKAVAHLSQRHFEAVRAGTRARVTLVSGATRDGILTAVAPRADEASRTFRIEVEVPNPDGVPANTSAQIEIPLGEVRAHWLSPALLTLDGDGRLGVKTVDDDTRVAFVPVEIVRSDARGVWVTGLPERARVITVGGGFVSAGERVRAVEAGTADTVTDS